jgi:tetratricopeptide (TPR) repeat protein
MSSNVYHKQPIQHRTRRDRVVVIDGAAKKPSGQPLNPDAKADQNIHRNIKVFLLVVIFMVGFLFLSIKMLEFLWGKQDRSIMRSGESTQENKPLVTLPIAPPPIITAQIATNPVATQSPVASDSPAKTPPENAEKIYRWGKVLEDAGEFDGALARYREALDVDPGNIMVLSQIGRLTIKLGKYAEAVQALEKAVATASDNPDIMNDLGVAMTFNGQAQEAVSLYDRLLEDFPDYLPALFNKGYALVQVRDYENARPLLTEYIRRKSDDAMAFGVLAVLELADKNYTNALKLLDQAIVVSPTWSMPYLDAAAVCAGMKENDRALDYLARALEFTSPTDIYQQFQSDSFRDIRATEAGVAFQKKIADRARELMKQP